MPLPRMDSEKILKALDEQSERKRKRLSLPNTTNSVTCMNPEKVVRRRLSRRLSNPLKLESQDQQQKGEEVQEQQRAARRLSLRSAFKHSNHDDDDNSNSNDIDKENAQEQRNKFNEEGDTSIQGPTPYYKVVEERGGVMSPRETRSSAKKKKRRSKIFERPPLARKDGVILFSASSQEENHERDEEDQERAREVAGAEKLARAAKEEEIPFLRKDRKDSVGIKDYSSVLSSKDGPTVVVNVNKQMQEQLKLMGEKQKTIEQKVEEQIKIMKENQKSSLEQANKRADEAKAEVDRLLKEKFDLVEERAKLRNELGASKTELEKLATESEAMLEAKAREYAYLETENCNLAAEMDTAQQQVSRLTGELEHCRQKIHRLEHECLPQSKAQTKEAHDKFQAQQQELGTAQKKAAAYRRRVDELQQEIEAITGNHNEERLALEQAARQTEQKSRALKHELNQARQRSHDLEKELDECRQKLEYAEKILLPASEQKLMTALSDLQRQREENAKLQSELERCSEEILVLRQEIETSSAMHRETSHATTAEMQELASEVERLEQENLDMAKVIDAMKMKEKEQLREIKGLQARLVDLEINMLPEAEHRLAAALDQVREQEERLAEAQKLADKRDQENAAALDRLQLSASEQNKTVERLEMELAAKDLQLKLLDDTVQELNEALDENQKKLGETSAQKTDLRNQLQRMEQDRKREQSDSDTRIQHSSKEVQELAQALQAAKAREEELYRKSNKQLTELQNMESKLRDTIRERDDIKAFASLSGDRERELHQRLMESDQVRRDLHAKVMQLMGNIRVFVRVRPLSAEEKEQEEASQENALGPKSDQTIFNFPSIFDGSPPSSDCNASADLTKKRIELIQPRKDRGGLSERRAKHRFRFDNVFQQHHSQDDVWDSTEPLIQSAVDGFNVTLFAYGQTGSGKTYTMLGKEGENHGIVQKSIRKLFNEKQKVETLSQGSSHVQMHCELLEIYNENVYDMLSKERNPDRKSLKLCMTTHTVKGNNVVPLETEEECMELLSVAQQRRCVKSTSSNAESSRSHLVFTIHFSVLQGNKTHRKGKLNICDLAGSERLSKSEAHLVGGALIEETKNINKSLSTLSTVIEQLQAGAKKISYRDSKLTSLLCDSLGGNSKTLAIICCSPLTAHYHESLSSLRFAEKASNVELKTTAIFSS